MIVRIDAPGLNNIGSIINKGKWRNSIHSRAMPISIAFEYYMEYLRQKYSPNIVSRLDCVFAFDNTTTAADGYILKNPGKIVYEIQPTIHNALITRHNYSVISHISNLFQYNIFGLITDEEKLLIEYWTGATNYVDSNGFDIGYAEELLIKADVTVIAIR